MAKEYCRFCGEKIDENDNVCPKCGKPTWKASEEKNPSNPKITQAEKSGKPKINFFQIALLIVIVVLVINMFLPSMIPVDNGPDINLNYKWSVGDKNFEVSLKIPKEYYNGVETSTIDRNGTVSSDRYITPGPDGKDIIVFGVKDYIVVDQYVKELADALTVLWAKEYHDDNKDMIDVAQFYAYFCQTAIDYADDNTKGQNEYWKYPIETLVDGKGDCEDTSILLAALIQASGFEKYSGAGGIFLLPGHAMAAIDVEALEGEQYEISHFGFYPIETALHKGSINLYKIGQVSEDYQTAYFQIYTGYSDTYYGINEPQIN